MGLSLFFFSSRRRHTRCSRDWSSDVCSSDLVDGNAYNGGPIPYGSKVDVTKGKVTLKADVGTLMASGGGGIPAQFILLRAKARSEERRVGKEDRALWTAAD